MLTAYIGLGANLGDRGETMRAALRRMAACPNLCVEQVSCFYETPPWGKTDQPSFDGTPHELLRVLQRIEHDLGRVRHEHWGARTIDLDILYVEDVVLSDKALTLPHPYLTARAFVLVPLAEIAPDLLVQGKRIVQQIGTALHVRPNSPRRIRSNSSLPVMKEAALGETAVCSHTVPRIWHIFVGRRWAGLSLWGGAQWRACPHSNRLQGGRILYSRGHWRMPKDFISCVILRRCGRCSAC